MTIAPVRTRIFLSFQSFETAAYLEELLWTLDGVESVMYQMDGEEHFEGLQVIGATPDLPETIKALCESYGLIDQILLKPSESVSEEDWAESWKQYWHVNRILPHLVIQPSWESFAPESQDIVLKLDPGSAFGTGTHETTQLMLLLLHDLLATRKTLPQRLLDVGTGSGILAIYGAKQGIPTVLGTDNDPLAVDVASQNVAANGVNTQVTCTTQDIMTLQANHYDVVLANILASVLQSMMPALKNTLSQEGTLILGGITRLQMGAMMACLGEHQLKLRRILQKGAWISLVCQRTS
jgi:ribosomal protein L11 methyltransferase